MSNSLANYEKTVVYSIFCKDQTVRQIEGNSESVSREEC